jgi:hypothetical protein
MAGRSLAEAKPRREMAGRSLAEAKPRRGGDGSLAEANRQRFHVLGAGFPIAAAA